MIRTRMEPPLSLAQTCELIDRVRQGDELALEQLLRRVTPRIERWARGRLPPAARGLLDTVDIVQDVVVNSLQHLEGFEPRGPGAFLAYLRRGLVHRLEDERRKYLNRPARGEMPEEIAAEGSSPLEKVIGAENTARYEAALARLHEDDQAAIIGRFEWGYSYAELATALDKPNANAARSAVVRAVARLVEQVGREPTGNA